MSHDETLQGKEVAEPAEASGRGAASTWAWATEHGAPEWASTEQLVSWLARGELPPHTLVWRTGWGEWLPAMQVAELAAAFPRVTAGSRRVARAAASRAAPPPPVPVAQYPRLRLLAKDVLNESPIPPAVTAPELTPFHTERHTLRDRDHLQQDLVTSQVPAAVMLEAARAMKQLSGPATQSSRERWSRLELGTFGEPPPAASAAPSTSTQAPITLAPLAMALPRPAALEPHPSHPAKGYGYRLLVGMLLGSGLALCNVFWREAADLLTPARVSLALTPESEDLSSAPRASDTASRALSPPEQSACIAPADPEPTASLVDRISEDELTVIRVSDLPPQRLRPLRSPSRAPVALHAIVRH